MVFVDCPEHLSCLAALCFEPVELVEQDMKRWSGFGFRDPLNIVQWPWAKEWIRQHPGYALQWVNHNPDTMTPERVAASAADWSPETQIVLDYSHGENGRPVRI